MDNHVSRKEFEELILAIGETLTVCAAAAEAMRESLIKTSAIIHGFKLFYCRKCKKTFAYRELEKVSGLSIPCPECGDGLIPASNVDFEKLENDK